ncbi:MULTISPECIES: helix-turn-helix domain-containing protein [Flavobacteriaceae]|uniref:helix-turn-helix domain-containing protein n=1 Tax=Flavobacteriaceae TaxID=49546 RepID=UPI003001A7C7
MVKLEGLIENYLKNEAIHSGLPTVNFFAEKLNISPNYLSDLLKNSTGKNAQTHIQECIIDRAKQLLSTTCLSVKEIAYDLGFEHPQSFSTMFRKNTQQTPLQYRALFN